MVSTNGTAAIAEDKIEALIREHFDLRPKGIIEDLDLLRPIYRPTADLTLPVTFAGCCPVTS